MVRDPVQRCLSAYLDKFCGEDSSKEFVQEVVNKFPGQRGISFRQFVEYLELEDNDKCNGHWRRQSYIADHAGKGLKVVRLENFHNDMQAVLGLDSQTLPELPNRNTSKKVNKIETSNTLAFDIKSDELMVMMKEKGGLPEKNNFLELFLVEKIKNIYKKDYEVLPYS